MEEKNSAVRFSERRGTASNLCYLKYLGRLPLYSESRLYGLPHSVCFALPYVELYKIRLITVPEGEMWKGQQRL